jgi:hypothetical protein
MAQRDSFGTAQGLQNSNLVQAEGIDFIGRTHHGAAPESDQIWIRRVCSNSDAAMMRRPHRRQHDLRVARVKAAGDISTGDMV